MRIMRGMSALVVAAAVVFAAVPATSQEVAKRATKRAAKEATESAARQATEDAAKKGIKKAMAPDAVDLNSATPEQLAKLGLDEATAKKVVEGRPYSSLEDPKIKGAIPADVLTKLQGKVTVKPATPATPATPVTPPSP